MKKKDLALSVCIALAAPSIASAESFTGIAALNLGDIKSKSYLDEPFRGSIPILHTSPEEATHLKVSLAPSSIFNDFGIEDQAILNQLKFKILVKNNKPYVDIRSSKAIDLPFLSFVIEVYSPEGSIYQDYTVLLDPRNYAASTASTNKTVNRARTNTSSKIINQRPTRVKVNSGDTLSKIAESVKLGGISNTSMAQAIFLSNPRAFSGNNANKLKKGFTLKIPTLQQVTSIQQTGKEIANKKSVDVAKKTPLISKSKAPVESLDKNPVKSHLVKSGDTLSAIARKYKPASTSFSDMMKAIHTENPHAFSNNNVNLLKKGARLNIPSFSNNGEINQVIPAKELKTESKTSNKKSVKVQTSSNETEFTVEHYKVKNNDTLGSVVKNLNYKDVSSSKMMEAIFTANPNAFEKDNITVLKAGSIIRIPTETEMRTVKATVTEPIKIVQTSEVTNVTDANVESAINLSLDRLEKRLREIRSELKTTQAKLNDLNVTLADRDKVIESQDQELRAFKEQFASADTTGETITVASSTALIGELEDSRESVGFGTLAELIKNDFKREKSLSNTFTYGGVALLLGLIGLRIGRQRYADRIVASEDYVPIANFEPQVVSEPLDFKTTLTEVDDVNTTDETKSAEENERRVDALMNELNQSIDSAINMPIEDEISEDELNEEEEVFENIPVEIAEHPVIDIDEISDTKQQKVEEPDFELIKSPLSLETALDDKTALAEEEKAEDLKVELLIELEDNDDKDPEANEEERVYTNRAQYQSHYALESTEIDLEKRLESINDEINVRKLEEEV